MRGKYRINTIGCKLTGYFREFDPSESILIFGDPRGGSTWVTEVLANATQSSVIWEPLKTDEVAIFRQLGFGYRQFIPRDQRWPEARIAFDRIFKGEVLNAHTCLGTNPLRHLLAKQLIIKICRGKALLPWMVRQYNLKSKPLLLLRHPFAVAASQMKHRGWNNVFEGFHMQKTPFSQQLYSEHKDFLLRIKTREEALIATWCLSNTIALNDSLTRDSCILIFYEQLVKDPEAGFGKILSNWGFNNEVLGTVNFKTPSSSSIAIKKDKDEFIAGWQSFFSDNQIRQMNKVLDYFSISVYGTDPMPRLSSEKIPDSV